MVVCGDLDTYLSLTMYIQKKTRLMSATRTRVFFVRILHSSIGFDRLITVSPITLLRLTLALWRILTSCVRNASSIYFFMTTTLLSFALFAAPFQTTKYPKLFMERAPFSSPFNLNHFTRQRSYMSMCSFCFLCVLAYFSKRISEFRCISRTQLLGSVPHHSNGVKSCFPPCFGFSQIDQTTENWVMDT